MKKLVRCKACGFMMEEGAYDECPACGVPSKMFEPWEDKVPENRRKILNMDIHPVIVHAPQAITFLLLILGAIFIIGSHALWLNPYDLTILIGAINVLSIVLPLSLVASMGSGVLDGYYRYKKVTTTLLVRKMIVGGAFFVLSILMLILFLRPTWTVEIGAQIVWLVATILAMGCSTILGLWGAKLIHGVMPGPFVKKKKPEAQKPAQPPVE